MTILKDDLESMLLQAHQKMFREPVFAKHPDLGRALINDEQANKKVLIISQRIFQKAVNTLMSATNDQDANVCYALAVILANVELQAKNFYDMHKTSKSYFTEFKNEATASSDSNEGFTLMFSNKNPILKQALRGILLTSLTATNTYKTQEQAEKELNKLIPDDLFEVEEINEEKFAHEGPIVESQGKSPRIYNSGSRFCL